jgi:hypothetical protein
VFAHIPNFALSSFSVKVVRHRKGVEGCGKRAESVKDVSGHFAKLNEIAKGGAIPPELQGRKVSWYHRHRCPRFERHEAWGSLVCGDAGRKQRWASPPRRNGGIVGMKRSFGKRVALIFWAVGSCGAVLFSCGWTFATIYTRKAPFGALAMVALGIFGAREGFKMFKAERNSN